MIYTKNAWTLECLYKEMNYRKNIISNYYVSCKRDSLYDLKSLNLITVSTYSSICRYTVKWIFNFQY